VPKDRPAARAWAARFMEEAKADGTVRRALDAAGFQGARVAPRWMGLPMCCAGGTEVPPVVVTSGADAERDRFDRTGHVLHRPAQR